MNRLSSPYLSLLYSWLGTLEVDAAAHVSVGPVAVLEPGHIPLLRLLRVNKFLWSWTNTLLF